MDHPVLTPDLLEKHVVEPEVSVQHGPELARSPLDQVLLVFHQIVLLVELSQRPWVAIQ